MRPSSIARRYAEAAFDVARSEGKVEQWLNQLRQASEVVARGDTSRFFRDPSISRVEKLQMLERLFPQFDSHVLNLLRMFAVRNRLHLVSPVVAAFEALDRQARDILEAEVTVARPLTVEEQSDVEQRLHRVTGKTVTVTTHVQPSLLGGIVVRVGDKLFDASVAGRLERLRQQMAM